ncbi:NADP-dependent malic enzyme [Patescibacteria group bacterium]|nr:NADP-dependent malic enzyme [Patescibacteria group bacterium]MBU1672887.1 NADP-dependent malic enzyme [Patescibacteria group bacterium]MBU1963138.1 NADP-dependent malic enzyme [Patescibacteria group bacterium]
MKLDQKALSLHKKYQGKIEIKNKVPLRTKEDLSLYYTPGVAAPCKEIKKNKNKIDDYTNRPNTIAIVTDGSAVLGLGNIGAEAGLPVMEGKANLFKKFANIDAYPILLNTQNVKEIIDTIVHISPTFAGINIEDISAPRCIEVENALEKLIDIPVFHDDQHGTAIAALAGLINALKLTGKKWSEVKIVINGAGAAGLAIFNLLSLKKPADIILIDKFGILETSVAHHMNKYQKLAVKKSNKSGIKGKLDDAIQNADVFIGVSAPGILKPHHIKTMADKPIIFAMANPVPEIMPDLAKKAGAYIIATGRSDFPNQINNALVFPGMFRAALEYKFKKITTQHKLKCAEAISATVQNPSAANIIPSIFDKKLLSNILKYLKP